MRQFLSAPKQFDPEEWVTLMVARVGAVVSSPAEGVLQKKTQKQQKRMKRVFGAAGGVRTLISNANACILPLAKLPREVVDAPSLETFKIMNEALSNLI